MAGAGFVAGIAAPVPQLSHRDDKVLEVCLAVDSLDPVLDDLDMPVMTYTIIYCSQNNRFIAPFSLIIEKSHPSHGVLN